VILFRDTEFLSRLRQVPWDISYEEFEIKIISGFVNSIGLQLPNVTGDDNVLAKIIKLHPSISSLQGLRLLDCDLSNEDLLKNIRRIYNELNTIHGLWITGISKITHALNDALFVPLNLRTSNYLGLRADAQGFVKWLRIAQRSAQEVTKDFNALGFSGLPEEFLTEKLGHVNYGCQKSLARFIDEYFWLTTSEHLPIPPNWAPPISIQSI